MILDKFFLIFRVTFLLLGVGFVVDENNNFT